MRSMFKLIHEELSAGHDLVLVTVVASSGATPRGAGARMVVSQQGRLCGTIGGGAVEYRSEQIAAQILKDKTSLEHDFTLTKDDVQNLGMICGGAVRVYFRYIPGHDAETLRIAEKAEELFAQGHDMWLISEISDNGRLALFTKESGLFGLDVPQFMLDSLSRQPKRMETDGRDFYAEQINSSGRVYVFGCGHVAQDLVPVLSHVGFRCVALDDRPEFASPANFPTAEEVLLIDFRRFSDFITVTEEDYIVVMTRGHAFDTLVQAQAVRTPACYIGVIGSNHKKAGVFATLKEEYSCSEEDLARITTPIGLNIKAETPAEIAISIAGQMIEFRARRNGSTKA